MKKFLVAGLLAVTLLVCFAEKADAKMICLTVPLDCGYMGGGPAGYGLVCGSTPQQRIAEYCELLDVVCN